MREPFPTKECLDRLYGHSWSEPQIHSAEVGTLPEERATSVLAALQKVVPLDGRIVDFGAGRGTLTRVLRSHGLAAVAVEPYGLASLQQTGIGGVTTLDQVDDPIQGIISLEVVEHLREPWRFFAEARRRLDGDGWLFVTTPNVEGLNARVTRDRWREFHKAGHVVLFTHAALTRQLVDAGFSDVRHVAVPPSARSGAARLRQRALQRLGLGGGVEILARP
jgi:2-polyprenyl-3-methyl-5-hydroxy-6-metoxy-1,4-benzoquinol methylase